MNYKEIQDAIQASKKRQRKVGSGHIEGAHGDAPGGGRIGGISGDLPVGGGNISRGGDVTARSASSLLDRAAAGTAPTFEDHPERIKTHEPRKG